MAGPAEILGRLPLFASLGAEDHGLLAAHCTEQRLARGEVIYRFGEPVDGYFVVAAGTVYLIGEAPADGRELLGRLRPGDGFGECGLFEGGARMETAEAAEPSMVLKLERAALLRVLEGNHLAALKLRLAAVRGYSARAGAGLAIAKRRAPRFFVHQDIQLRPADGVPRSATMVDLSILGVRIQGAPGTWGLNREVDLEMAWKDSSLRRLGRVAWYREGLAGIEFRTPAESEREEVRRALDRLLERREV